MYHIIFEVKIDLQHKSRLVTYGNRKEGIISHIKYTNMISHESIWIRLLLSALHDMDTLDVDIIYGYFKCTYTRQDKRPMFTMGCKYLNIYIMERLMSL